MSDILNRLSDRFVALFSDLLTNQSVLHRLWNPVCVVATLLVIFAAIATAQQSQLVPELPAAAFEYANMPLPAHFNDNDITTADNTPANNPISNEGATLGRVLFYDTQLSANDSISCSSCHLQEHGFSDPAALSVGFDGGLTGRNSMGLTNARYYENGHFFWDERADTLEEQALMPIQDSVEMGLTLTELETKLAAADYYPDLFDAAFGTPDITSERVALALSQFVRSMVSYQSKYDQGVAQNFANFTPQENQGRQIFEGRAGGCDACHDTAIQIADQPFNNGLDATTTDEGEGNGRFKVPSLRNVALTAPYMHDGRMATLEEVVEHYDSGVQPHPNLANQLRVRGNGGGGAVQPRRLNLSDAQKDALVAFMNTLTDDSFISDERFSNPFVDAPIATATIQPTATAEPTVTPTVDVVEPSPTPTALPTDLPTATPILETPAPTATINPQDQESVDVRPGRRREVRFGRTRNGNRVVLDMPADSLTEETTLTFTSLDQPRNSPFNARFAGARFMLDGVATAGLQGATVTNIMNFNTPVDFTVRYADDETLDEEAIQLYMLDGTSNNWVSAACGTESVNTRESTVSTQVCQLGEFALFEVTSTDADPTTPTTEIPPADAPNVDLSDTIFLPMISVR